MAFPGTPTNFIAQTGNAQVLLTWDISAGATSYVLARSLDAVTYTTLATVSVNSYVDLAVSVGTQYWYSVQASNGTLSPASQIATAIPTPTGTDSLGSLRLQAQQRADRVGSNFVTASEWNNYINQSRDELYDLLTNTFEDYYTTAPYQFYTDGTTQQYPLPPNFYKLMGVDIGLNANTNAWVTIDKFEFRDRNNYVYPNITSNLLGVFDARYRLVGNTLMFIPTLSANQPVRVWYIPRAPRLLLDTDIADGVNGWTEYIIVDAAIKALQKEESTESVQILEGQKAALIKRIEESAMNRDAGSPDTITNSRRNNGTGSNGPYGGI